MPNWIKRRKPENLISLQEKYHKMMKQSFEIALTDKVKSDRINAEALKLLEKIKILEQEVTPSIVTN